MSTVGRSTLSQTSYLFRSMLVSRDKVWADSMYLQHGNKCNTDSTSIYIVTTVESQIILHNNDIKCAIRTQFTSSKIHGRTCLLKIKWQNIELYITLTYSNCVVISLHSKSATVEWTSWHHSPFFIEEVKHKNEQVLPPCFCSLFIL